MKQITLSHTTALAALRDLRTGSRDTINLINDTLLNHTNPQHKFEILVSDKNNRYTQKYFNIHLLQDAQLKKFTNKLTYNISITCPELTILQLTSQLSYYELALLVHEFCGTFSISNDPEVQFISDLSPLTSVEKIRKFLKQIGERNKHLHGSKIVKEILTFASDNSASPMESRLYIKLCGPRSKGLYGCKNLCMNKEICLSNSASQISGQRIIKPDISSLNNKVAIEYDSTQFHENTEQGQRDKRRRDALVKDGWSMFTFVPAQIQNANTFDVIARQILKKLRQDYRIRGKNFIKNRSISFFALK